MTEAWLHRKGPTWHFYLSITGLLYHRATGYEYVIRWHGYECDVLRRKKKPQPWVRCNAESNAQWIEFADGSEYWFPWAVKTRAKLVS